MIRSIANLEVDCYTSCVDVTDIKNDLDSVRYEASYVCRDDEELEAAFTLILTIASLATSSFSFASEFKQFIADFIYDTALSYCS